MAVHSFREKDNFNGLPPARIERHAEDAQTASADTRNNGKKAKSRSSAKGETSKVSIRIGHGLFEVELKSESKFFIIAIVLLVFAGVAGLLLLTGYINGFIFTGQ